MNDRKRHWFENKIAEIATKHHITFEHAACYLVHHNSKFIPACPYGYKYKCERMKECDEIANKSRRKVEF